MDARIDLIRYGESASVEERSTPFARVQQVRVFERAAFPQSHNHPYHLLFSFVDHRFQNCVRSMQQYGGLEGINGVLRCDERFREPPTLVAGRRHRQCK